MLGKIRMLRPLGLGGSVSRSSLRNAEVSWRRHCRGFARLGRLGLLRAVVLAGLVAGSGASSRSIR